MLRAWAARALGPTCQLQFLHLTSTEAPGLACCSYHSVLLCLCLCRPMLLQDSAALWFPCLWLLPIQQSVNNLWLSSLTACLRCSSYQARQSPFSHSLHNAKRAWAAFMCLTCHLQEALYEVLLYICKAATSSFQHFLGIVC